MFIHGSSQDRRRSAFHPNLEAVERRALLGVVAVTPLGPGDILGTPGDEVQVQITPGTQVKVNSVDWGDGTATGRGAKFKITHSGKDFLIIKLPPHIYETPPPYNQEIKINNHTFSYHLGF